MNSGKTYVIPLHSVWIANEIGLNPFEPQKLILRILHSNSFSGFVAMPNGKALGLNPKNIEILEVVKLNRENKPTEQIVISDPANPLNDPDEYDDPLR